MRKPINILLVLAAIAALVTTSVGLAHRFASQKANRDALAAVLEKNAALETRITGLKTGTPDSRQTGATKAAAKNMPGKKRPEYARGPWGSYQTGAYQKERSKALEEHKINDHEFGLKYYAKLRSDVDMQYGPFYRLQHLTKEQADALSEALFQKALRYDQAGGSSADAQAAKSSADAELAAAAQEALGEDLYGQFALYERQRPAWDYVNNLGGMLSLADMPLSLEQASRLAGAMANANTSFQNGKAVKMTSTGEAEDWNAVDAAAADFLTPEQLDFFKNIDVARYGGVQSRQIMEVNNAFKKTGFQCSVGVGID